MTPAISVIIPVYRGEKYLDECIKSVLAQTFYDFELILLDDGSPDKCGNICDAYARQDARIRVIHKTNEGINATRRRGVEEAIGEWIAFVDDDDTLPKDALANLYEASEDTDIVVGYSEIPQHKRQLSLEECRESIITGQFISSSPWAKLYRRSILHDGIFDFPREIDGEEDMIMNIRLFFLVERAPHLVFKKVYNFRRNMSSVSHTKRFSIEHEDIFDRVRAISIPKDFLPFYMNCIIKSRLNGLFRVASVNPSVICKKEHQYMRRLMHDIELYDYRLTFAELLLLYLKPAFMVKAWGYAVMLKSFVKYHLGIIN